MKKRIISLILSLILLITLIPAALAEPAKSGACGDALTWEFLPDGTLEISGTGAMYDYMNRETAPWYPLRKEIKNIVVNEGLTLIGYNAFANCVNAESVTLPASMSYVRGEAFLDCLKIKDVYISNIAAWCYVIFEWPDRYTANPLSTAENLYIGGVLTRDVVIPEGVGEIRGCAFIGFRSLESVKFPSTIYSIQTEAFVGCSNLKCFIMSPANPYFTDVDGVLYNKDKSTIFLYPKGRPGDTYEVLPGTRTVGVSAFTNSSLKHVYLNDGLEFISNYSFSFCDELEEIVIPDSVSDFGEYVFGECPNLRRVVLSSGMSMVQRYLFLRNSFDYVVIPDSIKAIDYGVFFDGSIGDIYYGGDADEWAALMANTGYGNDSLENARLHLGTLEPEGHYTATATKPTCTAQGYTTYTCPCGNSYKDDYTDALGHDYGKGGVCTRCGEKSGNFKAPSFASRLLDSIRSIFESFFKWLPFC